MDPRTNFTAGVGFKRDKHYRLVMAFHGEDMMDASYTLHPHQRRGHHPSPRTDPT